MATAAKGHSLTKAPATTTTAVKVARGDKALPVQVREMRNGILAAVQSGDIRELLIPIQWNELPPDFGESQTLDLVADFKKLSIDGEGREILAILGNLLSMPYAVVREGRDIENNKVFAWPYFARTPFAKLRPTEKVMLLSILPRAAYATMKTTNHYSYWSIEIGADGTWHKFSKPKK